MSELVRVILLTTLAGAAMPFGGAIACIERVQPQWLDDEFRHSVIAFGGGVLLAAVSLVLLPEGIDRCSPTLIIGGMLAGGGFFLALDVLIQRRGGSASQLLAMLADFLPEAIALGALMASGSSAGLLLAILIAVQNLPEGFNAYREIRRAAKWRPAKIILLFITLVPLGPIAGLIGLYLLAASPAAVGAVMIFASGGILYLTFQDIAPQAKLRKHWAPAFGAVLGFLAGVVGHLLVQ